MDNRTPVPLVVTVVVLTALFIIGGGATLLIGKRNDEVNRARYNLVVRDLRIIEAIVEELEPSSEQVSIEDVADESPVLSSGAKLTDFEIRPFAALDKPFVIYAGPLTAPSRVTLYRGGIITRDRDVSAVREF